MSTTEALNRALFDRYVVERLIGEGGMATVYLARDIRHNRKVALKVLRPDLGAVVGVERFVAEIEVTANLQHPNLLPLFDSGAAGELLFYVMPYVQGESLRARLDREKQLPVAEAIRLATAIGGALDYAHRQGVIHRDLKPENILLQEGQPLVADFGIALAVSKAGGARVTQTGLSLGTPQYMSPEQATGDRVIDSRTDIYSLGALTYEMLAGEPPHYASTSQAIIARVLTERPRSIRSNRPSVPEQVEAAVEKALEKLPADRWETAHEFTEALAGARPVPRTTATTAMSAASAGSGSAGRARRFSAREGLAWGLVLLAGGVAAVSFSKAARPPVPAPVMEFEVAMPDSLDLAVGGSSNAVAISEDGTTLVFHAGTPGGATRLWLRRLGERTLQPIAGSEGGISPVLSPDGTELLFVLRNDRASTMYRLPVRGGTPRSFVQGVPGNGQVSWGADGQILFAMRDSLWIQPIDGGERRLVAGPDAARRHVAYGYPHLLPGGEAALVSIWVGARSLDSIRIGVVSLADGRVNDLGLRGSTPRFATSGQVMYVAADGTLFAVDFDPRSRTVTGRPVVLQQGVALGTGGAAAHDVSTTGTLAFVTGNTLMTGVDQGTLVAVDRTGKKRSFGMKPSYPTNPRVSPDGKQVVFSVRPGANAFSGFESDLWRLELESASLLRVTTDGTSDRGIFARDGSRILFGGVSDSLARSITLEAGAQPVRAFTWPRVLGTGDVGPAHGYAVFTTINGTDPDLWIAHLDSLDRPRPFAAESFGEGMPRISPDGRFVAYRSAKTRADEIYVRQLPAGGEEVRISGAGGMDPVWGPDGREIFYRTLDSLFVARVSPTPRFTVLDRKALFPMRDFQPSTSRSTYDVLPNGREFVMIARSEALTTGRRRLIVRLNWAERLGEVAATER